MCTEQRMIVFFLSGRPPNPCLNTEGTLAVALKVAYPTLPQVQAVWYLEDH